MYLTHNNIHDALKDVRHTMLLKDGVSCRFRSFRILEKGSVPESPSALYICEYPELPSPESIAQNDICIVCIGEEEACRAYALSGKAGLIAVTEKISLIYIINLLNDCFNHLLSWSYRLASAVSEGSDIRNLIGLSREIFGQNPVLLTNSSYNIIASSVDSISEEENPKLYRLLRDGYYSKELTDMFAQMGYTQSSYPHSKATYSVPPNYMNCPILICTFFRKMVYYGFLVVYFTGGKEPTEGEKELFCYYAKKIQSFYLEISKQNEELPLPLEVFLDDLLQHSREDEAFLKDRARALHIPTDVSYRVCIIKWENFDRLLAEYTLWRIRHYITFPYHRLLLYHDSVLLLLDGNISSLKVHEQMRSAFEEFISILKIGDGYAGFSLSQFPLMKINAAYKQALAAIEYGKKLDEGKRVYFYSTYYLYEILSEFGKENDLNDVYVRQLEQLMKPEGDDPYDNYHLLRTFILSERSISATARAMHMHRNSVIYRLNKIRDILPANLDNPDTRLRLMISFKILDLLRKDGGLNAQF